MTLPTPTVGVSQCYLTERLCLQVGNDAAALRILALELQDIVAAEQYCAHNSSKQDGKQSSYMQLLELLLHPGEGKQAMYSQACHLLGSQGEQ